MSINKYTEKYLTSIGPFIEFYRKEKGLSAYALANLSGVTDNAIRYCEQVKTFPTFELIIKISRGLGYTPSEFIKKLEVFINTSKLDID